jgi:hypothetical protein
LSVKTPQAIDGLGWSKAFEGGKYIMSEPYLFPFRRDDDVRRLPKFVDAMKSKDAVALADLLVTAVTTERGVIDLNVYGMICFGVAVRWIGRELRGRDYDELQKMYARFIKPHEKARKGIVMNDPEPLKEAVERYFTEALL